MDAAGAPAKALAIKDGRILSVGDDQVVLPIYRLVSTDEIESLQVPDFNQKMLCNYYFTTPPSGVPEIYCRVDYRPQVDRCVKFLEEQNRTIVAVEKEFIESVGEEIYHRFINKMIIK